MTGRTTGDYTFKPSEQSVTLASKSSVRIESDNVQVHLPLLFQWLIIAYRRQTRGLVSKETVALLRGRGVKHKSLDSSTEFIRGQLSLVKGLKADVSSVNLSSERIKELWVELVYKESGGATLLVGTWQCEKQEKVS